MNFHIPIVANLMYESYATNASGLLKLQLQKMPRVVGRIL